MTAYSAEIDLALDLLRDFGAAGTLTRNVGGGTYNPLTDTATGASPATDAVTAVVLPVSPRDKQVLADSLIGKVTRKALVAAKGMTMEPAPADTFTFATQTMTVEQVGILAPDGAPILYTLFLSR